LTLSLLQAAQARVAVQAAAAAQVDFFIIQMKQLQSVVILAQ
jgi:hypothetical protein